MLTLPGKVEAMGRLGRALADPTRCRILLTLTEGAAYPGALAEDLRLTRSNVSNHLSCLRGCGLVVATPEGRQMRYELASPQIRELLGALFRIELVVETDEACLPVGAPERTPR